MFEFTCLGRMQFRQIWTLSNFIYLTLFVLHKLVYILKNIILIKTLKNKLLILNVFI